MTPTQPSPHTHTHPTPYLGGCEEDLSKKTAPDGTDRMTDKQTDRQTDGHGDSMTDPAQRAESVKSSKNVVPHEQKISVKTAFGVTNEANVGDCPGQGTSGAGLVSAANLDLGLQKHFNTSQNVMNYGVTTRVDINHCCFRVGRLPVYTWTLYRHD